MDFMGSIKVGTASWTHKTLRGGRLDGRRCGSRDCSCGALGLRHESEPDLDGRESRKGRCAALGCRIPPSFGHHLLQPGAGAAPRHNDRDEEHDGSPP
jgi:hypothetical protein